MQRPLERTAQRVWLAAAVSLICFYLASSLFIALRRPFWYDEILTALLLRLPDWGTMWKALVEGGGSMPPAFFPVARLFDHWLGPAEIGARVPSALALAAGLALTFDCARRLSDNLHGVAALAVLVCSLLPFYGYEARPYSLYFLFVAAGLWIWVHGPNTKGGAAMFGLAAFLGFTVHFYSALCLLPYFVFEAARSRPWRDPSRKLMAGVVGVLCGLTLFWRQILATRQYSGNFWARPSGWALADMFGEFFPLGLFVCALALIWVAWTAKAEGFTGLPMPAGERLGWFFLSIPMAGYVAAKFVTNAFYNRYFIGMLPGVAIALASALWRRFGSRPLVSVGIVSAALILGIGKQVDAARHAALIQPPSANDAIVRMRELLSAEASVLGGGKQTIVVRADDLLGLEARYYSQHPEVYAFLLEPGMEVVGWLNQDLARFSPMRFWTLDDLRQHAKEAALVDVSNGTLEAMRAAGMTIRPHGSGRVKIFYLD